MEQNWSLFPNQNPPPPKVRKQSPFRSPKAHEPKAFVFYLWSSSNARERGETFFFPRNPSLATAPRLPSPPSRTLGRGRYGRRGGRRRTPRASPRPPRRQGAPLHPRRRPHPRYRRRTAVRSLLSPISHKITPHANNCSCRSTVLLISR